jgi:predicted nuclease of predicted toxin-antitoxin system
VRVKLDENLPVTVRDLIVEAGHEVDTVVGENLGGAPDEQVLQGATQADRLLFTLDRGFGTLARRLSPHPGVVVLRLPDQRVANVEAAVANY